MLHEPVKEKTREIETIEYIMDKIQSYEYYPLEGTIEVRIKDIQSWLIATLNAGYFIAKENPDLFIEAYEIIKKPIKY